MSFRPFLRLSVFVLLSALLAGVPPAAAQQAPPQQPVINKETPRDEPRLVLKWRDRYEKVVESGVALTAGSIVSGSGVAAGIILGKRKTLGGLGAVVEARWSLRGYRQIDGEVGMTAGRRHRTELRSIDSDSTAMFNQHSLLTFGKAVFLHVREQKYPRVDFYGPDGMNASRDGRSDYAVGGGLIDLVGQWQRPHFGASARVGSLRLKLETPTNDGLPDTRDLYASAGLPGLNEQRHYRTMGAAFTVDFRDQAQLTERGMFAGIALWQATASGAPDSSQNFSRLNLDAQQFLRVKKGSQVIALRGVLSSRIDNNSGATPFYLQPTLGGGKTLRGFGSYRWRDESLWAATAEYRWRAHRRIELAPFVDVGSVARRFGDFRSTHVEVAPGIGLRIVGGSRIIGRVDYAHGSDGHRVMFALGSPF